MLFIFHHLFILYLLLFWHLMLIYRPLNNILGVLMCLLLWFQWKKCICRPNLLLLHFSFFNYSKKESLAPRRKHPGSKALQ